MPQHVAHPLAAHPELSIITSYTSTSSPRRKEDDIRSVESEGQEGVVSIEYRVTDAEIMHARGLGIATSGLCKLAVAFGMWWVLCVVLERWAALIIVKSITRQSLAALVTIIGSLYSSSRTLLYESAHALPSLGIQLSQTRGLALPWLRLSPSLHFTYSLFPAWEDSTFIPLSSMRMASAVFVNEGLRRWSVRYYLGVMEKGRSGRMRKAGRGEGVGEGAASGKEDMRKVHVVFETLSPKLPVLREVYYGLRETMFDDYAQELETG